MEKWAHSLYLKNIRETIDQYQLIEAGDRVLLGLSGGKDSGLLFKALHDLSRYGIYDFKVTALTIDHGMMAPIEPLKAWCHAEEMDYKIYQEPFGERLKKSESQGFSACYACARMRKGILRRYALEHGYNKIAFGHTRDDLIETLLMNVLNHGRMAAIPAKLVDEDSGIEMIRPLIRLEEEKIIAAGLQLQLPIIASTCTFAPQKNRAKADRYLKRVESILPGFSEQMTKALQNRDEDRLL